MTEVKQYGDKRINAIMQAFTDHIGLEPTPKQLQRRYCKLLINAVGENIVDDVVAYAISIQDDYYAPRITSPKDLYYKVSKVMGYYKQQQGNEMGAIEL